MSLSHQYVQDHLLSIQRLNPSEQAALEEHLVACPECRAYALFHQKLLQTLPFPDGSPRPSERDIREKIQTVREKVEKRRWPARIVYHTLSFAGAAVGLVLLFLILILTMRTMPGRPAISPDVTHMAAGVANITPTATGASTPLPSTETTMPFLSSFPLYSGTTWVWMKTGYTQAEGDPQKIIQGTAKIEERVADIQTVSAYQLVHIRGNKVMVSSDPGWQENGTFGLGDYEYWFVVKDNQVYLSYGPPDPAQMQLDQMRLLSQFPLQVGSEWCPGVEIKSQPVPDIQSCGNKTIVTSKGPYASLLGAFTACYEIHDTSNSGDVISQFCEGIGLVAQKYDHAGTQFGSNQELIQFTNGKDGSTRFAPTPTAASTSIPAPTVTGAPLGMQNRVVPAVAVQGQTAYVGIGSRLAAIDFSQPGTPQLAAQSVDLPGEVIKVISLPGRAGQRVAASAGRYLALLDTLTPNELTLITQSKLPGPITALIFDISNQNLYAGGMLEGDAGKGFVAQLNATTPDTLQLLGTSQLPAPVQSLALANGVLYAALTGDPPKVVAVPIRGNTFGEPTDAITGTAVASMTTTGGLLYLGANGQMLAYDLTKPLQPQFVWQISEGNQTPIPGTIFGFEVRPNTIFTAGRDAAGVPFHLALTTLAPLKTGSMVDTASCVAVSAGQMLVAGDRLEIYDNRDPQHIMLLGSYPLVAP